MRGKREGQRGQCLASRSKDMLNAPFMRGGEGMEALTTEAQGSPARSFQLQAPPSQESEGPQSVCPFPIASHSNLPGLEGLDDEDHIPVISLSPASPCPAWLRVRGQDEGMSKCLGWNIEASIKGFPDSSVGKGSTCNAEDPSSIPGSGRSPGEGIGYPLQYSWASLVAQLVKNPPTMRETWV